MWSLSVGFLCCILLRASAQCPEATAVGECPISILQLCKGFLGRADREMSGGSGICPYMLSTFFEWWSRVSRCRPSTVCAHIQSCYRICVRRRSSRYPLTDLCACACLQLYHSCSPFFSRSFAFHTDTIVAEVYAVGFAHCQSSVRYAGVDVTTGALTYFYVDAISGEIKRTANARATPRSAWRVSAVFVMSRAGVLTNQILCIG